jgi:NAD(P)-dependent dehydrogenase (short-subunit alcohol dehydrogenase family)
VAIVTGAGQGIGRACALHLADLGARVLVNSRLSPGESPGEGRAARVVAQIVSAGGQAQCSTVDAADPDVGQRLVDEALRAWGRIDMVHANAARGQHASFAGTPLAELRAIMDVGFGATMGLFHAAWPVMKAQGGGRLLATSSSAGRFGGHGLSAYGASKAAVEALVRSLAAEGVRHGIRCNAISPYARTQMTAEHLPPAWADALPAEALAPVVAWLLSPACPLNGEVVVSGGGRHARAWSVETAAVAGDLGDGVWAQLQAAPGHHQPGAVQAFAAFMEGVEA